MITIESKKLSNSQLNLLNEFQSILLIMYDLSYNKSIQPLNNQYNDLKQYSKFNFLTTILKSMGENIQNAMYREDNIKKVDDIIIDVIKVSKSIEEQINIALKSPSKINANILKSIEKSNKDHQTKVDKLTGKSDKKVDVNLEKSIMSSFFSGGKKVGFLSSFSKDEHYELCKKKKLEYNHLLIPTLNDKIDAWIYYLQNSTDESIDVVIQGEDVSDYMKLKYGENYIKLDKMIEKYLYNNDKSLLSKIQKEIQKYPILQKEIRKSEERNIVVYRGIGFEDRDDSSRLNLLNNKKDDVGGRFIATTQSEHTAKQFAKYGQTQSAYKLNTRYNYGLILKYKLKSGSIVLDTDIFGGVFGENEIVIDTKISKLVDVYPA